LGDAVRCALEYALKEGPATAGAAGEPIFFCGDTMRIMVPIIPKEFFNTAGNFGEHHEEAQKAGFSHPVRRNRVSIFRRLFLVQPSTH
jgi:hypothetical protein